MALSTTRQTRAEPAALKVLVVAVAFSASLPLAASSFGALHYDTAKEASYNTTYTVALINPGNSTLDVRIETLGLEQATASTPMSLELHPSRTSDSPPGEGWVYRNGRYIQPREFSFSIYGSEPDKSFNLRLEARRSDRRLSGGSARVVRVLEKQYDLEGDVQTYSSGDEGEQPGPDVVVQQQEEEENETGSGGQKQQEILTLDGDEGSGESGFSLKTAALAVAAIGSIYILVVSL